MSAVEKNCSTCVYNRDHSWRCHGCIYRGKISRKTSSHDPWKIRPSLRIKK